MPVRPVIDRERNSSRTTPLIAAGLLGCALTFTAGAIAFGARPASAEPPERSAGSPHQIDHRWRPTDVAVDPTLLPGLDELPPEAIRARLKAAGWVIVGEPRTIENEIGSTYDLTAALARPKLGTVDGTVMLYRFRHAGFVDRVLPFLQNEAHVSWMRGERTLVVAHVRKNPEATELLLDGAAGLPFAPP